MANRCFNIYMCTALWLFGDYQTTSSSCSTSYNIHGWRHFIPPCPFNGCRYPAGDPCRTAGFSGYSGDSIRLFTAFWGLHTHTQYVQTHMLGAGRCHGYIKAETANFDQLLTVTEWDSGDTEKWWNKVPPSLTPFILIGNRDTISHRLWHNQYSSLVPMHSHWHTGLGWGGARRNYEEIRRCIWARFEVQYVGCVPEALILSPPHNLFILFNLECNYRVYCDGAVSSSSPSQLRNLRFLVKVLMSWVWLIGPGRSTR